MKKWIFCLMAFGLVACSEKDEQYYLSHPEQAQEKAKQCRNQENEALIKGDKEAYRKIENSKECQAARSGLREYERQQQEKRRLEQEAKEKAAIEEIRNKLDKEFGQLDWQEFTRQFVNTQCATGYIRNDDYACRALKSIYDEKISQATKELAKVSFNELLAQEKKYCARDQRKFSACSVWEQAIDEVGKSHFEAIPFNELEKLKENFCVYDGRRLAACRIFEKVKTQKEQDIVNAYVKNYDNLKRDYNQCVESLAQIGNDWKKYEQRLAVSDHYPCPQAREARSKLGLPYDNFETLME
ncbi:hypothetical protein JFL47_00730 [Haemophilus haemoglobinophilus]|nr:hypothetical protein [Canicola haemoglobinophilus]